MQDPPYEGNTIEVKRGHVCFIPGGKDWFIALGDHPEWGTSHPVSLLHQPMHVTQACSVRHR